MFRLGALIGGLVVFSVVLTPAHSDEPSTGYKKPPEAIRKILDLPPQPNVTLSPDRKYRVLVEWQRYPTIADLARPTLRLAGKRIDPATNGPEKGPRYTSLSIRPLTGGKDVKLNLPTDGHPGLPDWSPDGKQFALAVTTPTGIDLYVGRPGASDLRKIKGVRLNAAYGDPIVWLEDSETLVCRTVPIKRGKPPEMPTAPSGPVIQETSGKKAPARTYQDLLKNPHDEALFDYYFTSQLVKIDVASGKVTMLDKPAVISACVPSPDGKYLLVTRKHRPYSYTLPATAFPREIFVMDLDGKKVHQVADLPLSDTVPIEGVPTGPRNVTWRSDLPAVLVWVEALDGGDPAKKVPHRDQVWMLSAPFTGKKETVAKTEHRFGSLTWGEHGLALLDDYNRDNRHRRVFLLDVDHDKEPRMLWDRSVQDRYNDPGTPLMMRSASGRRILRVHGDDLFFIGAGASPKGEHPFLDRYNLKTGKTQRLFQSKPGGYEVVLDVLSDDGSKFLTRHESPTSPPNLRLREVGKEDFVALTDFTDPAPQLRKITRKRIRYKRADGVPLSFTLYLPPDYKEGTRLPTVVWAYPREYTDPKVAGQVLGSTDRYTSLVGTSHLFFLLAGYAVLDGATMPVVGTPEKANDTFVEQIVSSAKAAIDKATELGVTDPDRVGVGGHSYGAFMTANLLAHSDLFRAGIARSGAYNRTLTPFGFQSERRTFWQAPKVYLDVSPFMAANKINEPLLLIHGIADNNSGTFPIQSERLYQAIKGNGGTARLVMLPNESHGYSGKESVEHVLWEMVTWFDRHVKNAPPRKRTTSE